MTAPPLAFSGHGLDRADQLRVDSEAMAALRSSENSRLLRMEGLTPVLDDAGRLSWSACDGLAKDVETVFLGIKNDVGLFAAVPEGGDLGTSSRQRDWFALSRLAPDELAIYGGARSLVDWHARHRFCAQCGQGTQIAKGGWQRTCISETCGAQHFPRVDPVAIMLIEHGGRMLLGHGLGFPEKVYSALAGFIEPGESIEEAVTREVFEEAGVTVRNVRYIASQPWPFPSQLMIGCHAYAEADALKIDTTELADARWFSREQIAAAFSGGIDECTGFRPPPDRAIAAHLLRWWLDQENA